ncbi:MAG TPA: SDR family NAD(P)-dependent oxidoreductase, partial [Streptomyces sp.]|nr:SDR family NAD(P)-dependent oxidoreductase [Streptomyces sp.]
MSRVVIVSGGGTGIGRAAARRFATDGDRVLLIGRRAEVLREAAESLSAEDGVRGEIQTLDADLSIVEAAERVRTEVDRRYGRVDVLVNNAG